MNAREWLARIRGSLRRPSLEREMDVEMGFHLERAAERNAARGMSPDEAKRQARLSFGSEESIREEARGAQRARFTENVIADVRYALRSLSRSPSFTMAAILTVALGIGASTAIFTVVNGVLLRPLPVPEPENFVYVGWSHGGGGAIPALTGFQFEYLRDQSRTLEAVATYRNIEQHVGDDVSATSLRGMRVTHDFFRVTGLSPSLGREFDSSEAEEGSAAVVILGDGAWRSLFAGDPGIVGRQVRLGGEPHTVVGVMPVGFQFPGAPAHTSFLVPYRFRADPADEGHNFTIVARAANGASPGQRAADLERVVTSFRTAHPDLADDGDAFRLYTHAEVFAADVRRTLWLLFGAVSLVLLIACANTVTLLLIRASGRQREIAVRASLGAGPRRLIQQLLAEGMVLSVLAAGLGVLIGAGMLRIILAAAPAVLPAVEPIQLDMRVLVFVMSLSIVTGLVFGLAAAIPGMRTRLQGVLLGGSRDVSSGGTRTREALVLLQMAIAVMLLFGATLLAASFGRLIRTDPGFDTAEVVAVRLGRMPPGVTTAQRDQFAERALLNIRDLTGVTNAALASSLPLERGLNFPIDIAERPDLSIGDVELRFVSTGYFETLGVPLLGGRHFERSDTEGTEPVAIVNEAFAQHFWSAASPIGETIQIGHYQDRWIVPPERQMQTRVIGVVGNMRELGLHRAPKPTVLVPRAQSSDGAPLLIVRTQTAAPELLDRLRHAVQNQDPRLVPEIERLSAVVGRSVATPRFRMLLITSFAASSLLLAGIGICGVIASVVLQRRREIGVRLALGATRGGIALSVVRRCLAFAGAGAFAGAVCFWFLKRVLDSMLYETSASDPRVLLAVIAALGVAVAVSSWIPARRATKIDPALSLRSD